MEKKYKNKDFIYLKSKKKLLVLHSCREKTENLYQHMDINMSLKNRKEKIEFINWTLKKMVC